MPPVVSFQDITKYFVDGLIPKRKMALDGVSFELEKGKTYACLGPNGAGKTTTIKIMLGFLFPSKGNVRLFSLPPDNPRARYRAGYVSDYPNFYEYLSGKEYLHFCGELYGLSGSDLEKHIPLMLEKVNLQDAADKKLRDYSRGMAQRLNFAQALIHDPELIILDEPFNGLDPFGHRDLRNIVLELKSKGRTIFFSSHMLEDAEILADEILFIDKGKIILQAEKETIREKYIGPDKFEPKLEDIFLDIYGRQ